MRLSKRLSSILLIALPLLFATPLKGQTPQDSTLTPSNEEAFLLRRIAEFHKDEDSNRVKRDIAIFVRDYPSSEFKGYLQGLLADIHLQEGSFEEALSLYDQIEDMIVIENTIINKLQCLYELDKFQTLIKEARPFVERPIDELEPRKEELSFLMAEALFRDALKREDVVEKQKLAKEAKEHYKTLKKPDYQISKAFANAEIFSILEENKEAAKAYRILATNHETQREDLLFKAALSEAAFNVEKATQTFVTIQALKGKRANEALFNQIVLLFQAENYEEVLNQAEKIAPNVPDHFQELFLFMVGKSHFSLDQYQEAIGPLGTYISSQDLPSDRLKNALFIQMTCAHYLNDEALFNASFDKLNLLFPEDIQTPKALFMHAMMLKERGEFLLAEERLQQIKELYPSFEDQESFLFEYGFLAHQNERWEESCKTFKTYLALFQEEGRLEAAWKLFLSSSLNRYKEALEADEPLYKIETFFEDLQMLLTKRQFFSETEWVDYTSLYAKIAYELDRFEDALHALQDNIFTEDLKETPNSNLAEAHFIAALCYSNLKPNYPAFCMHLEEALNLNEALYDSATTHLQLYNAYISLAGFGSAEEELSGEDSQQIHCLAQAAEHLYEVISGEEPEIKEENRLWLANHYYEKAKEHFDQFGSYREEPPLNIFTAIERAADQYLTLLYADKKLLSLEEKNLHLESDYLKLAKILEYQGNHREKLSLLKELIEQQNHRQNLRWEAKQEALFELGRTYLALDKKKQALETFSFINRYSSRFPTLMGNMATLQAARLKFKLLEFELRTDSNKTISEILDDLKALQIRKSGIDFPLHLEAALEYADIRAAVADQGKSEERYTFFLNRIKEDFNAKDDLVTQSYLSEIEKNEEKKSAFNAYMSFIQAEKLRLKANIKQREEKIEEMKEHHAKALAIYNKIKTNPHAPYPLFERTLKSIEKINAVTNYEE